ncbi:hypothetical protein [Pantoea stewartii]|uniref:hypothetical protein n=1 Tax=Pantoea stewartii TaxID=66269 RepID=UPI0016284072|nr:hypothetical protein [Pantoea stewartii]MBC0853031.1 hypothetical protein [Pantoea stewartii]
MIDLFSYNEALNFLEVFFDKMIKDEKSRKEMQIILDGSRDNKTVSIRAIDVCFKNYRKKFADYRLPNDEETEFWKHLIDIWQ